MPFINKKYTLITLILTVMIDIMGVGLVLPIMPALFFGKFSVFSSFSSSHLFLFYSIILAAWPLGLVVGSPIIGELSDKIGRKKSLLLTLLLLSLAYVISVIGIVWHDYFLFVFGRFLCGFSGVAYEICQAMVIDISEEKNKAKNIGYITAGLSVGYILGPIIAGISSSHYFAWSSLWLAFAIGAGLSFFNFLLVKLFTKTDEPKAPHIKLSFLSAIKAFLFFISDKRIRLYGVAFLLMQMGWGLFTQTMSLYLNQVYHYQTLTIGLFYSMLGAAIVFGSLWIQPKLQRFSYRLIYQVAGLAFVAAIMIAAIVRNSVLEWFMGFIVACALLVCYSVLLALMSSKISSQEQGKLMGSAGAAYGLAWLSGALITGFINQYHISYSLILGGIVYLCAVLSLSITEKKKSDF